MDVFKKVYVAFHTTNKEFLRFMTRPERRWLGLPRAAGGGRHGGLSGQQQQPPERTADPAAPQPELPHGDAVGPAGGETRRAGARPGRPDAAQLPL